MLYDNVAPPDDIATSDFLDPPIPLSGCECDLELCCVECDTDWREQREDYLEFIKPSPVWPSSKDLLSDRTLAFLRSVEPPGPAPHVFTLVYEVESPAFEFGGLLLHNPEPPDGEFSLADAYTALSRFFRPKQKGWVHKLMRWFFWITTFLRGAVVYLIIGDGSRPKENVGSRASHRRLIRHRRGRLNKSSDGFLPPLLRFLSLRWTAMSNTVQVPYDWYPSMGNVLVPGLTVQRTIHWAHQFVNKTSNRVQCLDDRVVFNIRILTQYNSRKFESLIDGMFELGVLIPSKPKTNDEFFDTVCEHAPLSNDEFFESTSELAPLSNDDRHFDVDEGQYFFDGINVIKQEKLDPFDIQSVCAKRTVVNCKHGTCDDQMSNLIQQ
jgi:hypothetical protein